MIRSKAYEFVFFLKRTIGLDAVQFLKHSKNYLSAEFFTKALSFISIPVLTRLLTPEEYGILATFSSIILVGSIIFGIGFKGAVARYYYENTKDVKSFLGSSTLFLIGFNFVVILILLLYDESLAEFLNIRVSVLWFSTTVSVCLVFFNIYLSLLQASKKSKRYARLAVIKSFLILGISIPWIILLQNERYFGKIYGQTLVTVAISLWAVYKIFSVTKLEIKKKHIIFALGFGLPLLPHALSGYALAQFDRVIINQLRGSGETGFYSLAYNVGMIMNVIVMGMNKSWVPIFYEKKKEEKHDDLKALAHKYAKIIALIASLLILFSNHIAQLLAPGAYADSFVIIPIIITGYYFVYLYTLYGSYAFYERKTFLISINTVIAGSVNVVLNYMFIPEFGYVFAAYTTLISYILLFLLHYLNVRFFLKSKHLIPVSKATSGWAWIFCSISVFYFLYFLKINLAISIVIELLVGVLITWSVLKRMLNGSVGEKNPES